MLKCPLSPLLSGVSLFAIAPASAFAMQEVPEAEVTAEESETVIIVTAERVRGAVETDAAPIDELSEADVQALGGSSVADIVAAVAPQAGSGRGRGSGPPVILLNGQRISSFRDIRDLPPEAIKQVQIFPEEVALQYGFRPDQRVINFILKDNFASFNAEVEYAAPQKGGFDRQEFETNFTRIGKDNRFNVDIEFERRTKLTEDERDIVSSAASAPYALAGNITGLGIDGEIDPALSALAGETVTTASVPGGTSPTLAGFAANANQSADGDIGAYRTLLPSFQRFQVTTSWSKVLGPQTNFALNGSYELQDQQSLNGLPSATFLLPASSSFSPFGQDVALNRYFLSPRALERSSKSNTLQFGAGFNSVIGGWRLALTADYDLSDSETTAFTNADYSVLRSAVSAGTVNPFAAQFGSDLLFSNPDTSDSSARALTLRGTLSGRLFMLPAGPVTMTLSSGFDNKHFDTRSFRRGISTDSFLKRNRINGAVNVEVPLVERDTGGIGAIGDFSVNGNFGISDVSSFGRLVEYGAGLRWSPVKGLSFSASLIGDETAPTLSQLGNPLITTPNVAYFDFVRGESRFIDVVSGGNPALVSEKRRDIKLGVDWSPSFVEGLGLQLEYFRNRSSNTTSSFPMLTPEIEAAFPDRVFRDADGQLIRIDQRAVNYAREKGERIRWGFNMSGSIGKQPQGGGPMGMGGGGRGPGAGGPRGGGPGAGRPGGGGGGRGPMGMPGGGPPSRWQVALYHTYRINEQILIRPGVPLLDLLNGSARDSLGGAPRHELTLSGGAFFKGLGFRLEGNYRSATRIDGNALTGSGDLHFGDLASLNAFIFINLDQRGDLTKKVPLLKGSRIAIRVDNVLGTAMDVRDAAGNVPLSYQPGLLDPQGRVFEISFRKRF